MVKEVKIVAIGGGSEHDMLELWEIKDKYSKTYTLGSKKANRNKL